MVTILCLLRWLVYGTQLPFTLLRTSRDLLLESKEEQLTSSMLMLVRTG